MADDNTLSAFASLISGIEPKQRDNRRASSASRGSDTEEGRRPDTPAPTEGTGGSDRPAKPRVDEASSSAGAKPGVKARKTGQEVLEYLESIADDKDYFRKLEHTLKANVSVLVPNYMSAEVFARTIANLRDANDERDRGGGVDPLGMMRTFLNGGERVQ